MASEGPAVLEGVVRSADGRPAARALVVACVPTGIDADVGPVAGTSTADGDGRFRIALPRWPGVLCGACLVAWSHDRSELSMRAAFGDHPLSDEGARCIDIDLLPTGTLEGRVTDAAGLAIAGAQVLVWTARPDAGNSWRAIPVDAEGRYRVDGLLGLVSVRATAPGHLGIGGPETVSPGGRTEVRRVLSPRERRLDLRFLDERGEPVAGLPISAVEEPGVNGGLRATDAEGRAEVPWPFYGSVQVDPGPQRWLVTSVDGVALPNLLTWLDSDDVRPAVVAGTADPLRLEVRVRRGARLRGTVRFANGAPAGPGLTVFLEGRGDGVSTDEEGRFEFDGTLPVGECDVRCLGAVTRVGCAEGDTDVALRAPDAFRLELRLIDASGAPAWTGSPKGLLASLHAIASHPRSEGVSFGVVEDGRLVAWLERFPADAWDVRVWMDGGAELGSVRVAAPARSGEAVRRDLPLPERTFGSLRCRLVDARTGHPLASGMLALVPEPARPGAPSRYAHATDATRLEVPLLSAGRWKLVASTSGYDGVTRFVDVSAGPVTDLGDVALDAAKPK